MVAASYQSSVDRTLLLRLVHCCAAAQLWASAGLQRALQHRLDLSCSSFMDLEQEEQREALRLTAADCWALSIILGYSSQEIQLDLRDCEVDDFGLDLLLPVLDRVQLRASKAVLLQLVSLIPLHSQRDSVKRAASLWRALDGELDLSHSTLDQWTCSSLARLLDSSEGLTELDLSHCELTDQLLHTLIPQLHKVQVLDLSHNKLTDASTNMLLHLTSIRSSIQSVRVIRGDVETCAHLLQHLDTVAVREGGFLCWSQTAAETSASLSVEISSYVLLAKLSASPTAEDLGYASGIIRWLTGQQNYYGGFSSTQVLHHPNSMKLIFEFIYSLGPNQKK
ncbi:uncharacterized protein LOC120435074 [Oreochromis aureus]|uniref:uncharacterized protein LOC120435074 n=1 Tax=Oreochromis aureus TaxID=47969 RepID=UPI00195385A2|nr:uncharacterized protein LOC120435074 [Oreochromis aureus]